MFQPNWERNLVEETQAAEEAGDFIYVPPADKDDEDDDFAEASADTPVRHERLQIVFRLIF